MYDTEHAHKATHFHEGNCGNKYIRPNVENPNLGYGSENKCEHISSNSDYAQICYVSVDPHLTYSYREKQHPNRDYNASDSPQGSMRNLIDSHRENITNEHDFHYNVLDSHRDICKDSFQELFHIYDCNTWKTSGTKSNLAAPTSESPSWLRWLSDRPCPINTDINFPLVDLSVLEAQHKILSSHWPKPTPDAYTCQPDFCELYDDILSFSLPNFMGARRTIASGLNLECWEALLKDYHDNEICYFLRYGWPIGYHSTDIPKSISDNHPSALAHPTHIQDFLEKEAQHAAIVGPFKNSPFHPWVRLSPMMTRPKKNSLKRRVIIDLSFPEGASVNDGIRITSIYGRDSSYTLPNINDLTEQVSLIGKSAWIWKADLERAYRQLRLDPIDTPLMGLTFQQQIFLDICPSFGCRSSSSACQRVTAAVTYLMRKRGWTVLAFLDDFAGIENSKEKAQQAYTEFLQLTTELGLTLAEDKCSCPTQQVEWLGYEVDVLAMTVSIPPLKLAQVLDECERWENKKVASKNMIQSLVGKLIHIANCIRHARKFVARILSTLRYMVAAQKIWTSITPNFRADVAWFKNYAELANGIALITPSLSEFAIECDSSLTGGGGNSITGYYAWEYSSDHIQKYPHIHHLEAINIIVAYRTLCPPASQGTRIVIITDNMASSLALSTGRTKDSTLASCARQLWLEAAKADHEIKIVHRPGTLIPLADALSRAHNDLNKAAQADKLVRIRRLNKVSPVLSGYSFFDKHI